GKDGNFYGTTANGGARSNGTFFAISPSGTLTRSVSFNGADGSHPYATVVQDAGGTFYGTTFDGGSHKLGTIFSVTESGPIVTRFAFSGTNGMNPREGLTLGPDGNLYGTTAGASGTTNVGTLFRFTPAGDLTTLVWFNGTNGLLPGLQGHSRRIGPGG